MTNDVLPPALDAGLLDPLGDEDQEAKANAKHNRAKVGSARPSSLLYTYGPGSIMDLPQFTVMPSGFDDWEKIWERRNGASPEIHAPRLRAAVRRLLGWRDVVLRPYPRQLRTASASPDSVELGVPCRVFPQWLRCTGCDMLGVLTQFDYVNTHPYRPDLARFEHGACTGRRGDANRKKSRRPAVPARYLLACIGGHVDEFPYDLWVHRGQPCEEAQIPVLKMEERTGSKGASAVIVCRSCGEKRPMSEAQGEAGRAKLPNCRGRYPHLDMYTPGGCVNEAKLMVVGASNLWFPSTQSVIVMPESDADQADALATHIRLEMGDRLARLHKFRDDVEDLRDVLGGKVDLTGVPDAALLDAVDLALSDPDDSPAAQAASDVPWDPVDLLVPEWRYLLQDPPGGWHEDPASGLTLATRDRGPELRPEISRVLAVERLRKVNALIGFTRIDDVDRAGGEESDRLVPISRKELGWTVATEDRGEGIFLQLDENAVAAWEKRVGSSELWIAHREAHRRNFANRSSETAKSVDPDSRLPPPRYWLVHTLAHVLMRQMALTCGYSATSLSERLYAWPETDDRPASAGLLICTTAADSDGTLGGLVALSEPDRLQQVVSDALHQAERCSSDPICSMRTPKDNEDFLHGAACHCCSMASETSCERANRFLDRRFLINLPGHDLGFFGTSAP